MKIIESVGTIIERAIRNFKIDSRVKEGKIFACWEQIIDPDLAHNVFPDHFEKGVLYLKVTSPVEMSELKLRQKKLIKKINDYLGEKFVTDFRINLSGSRPAQP